MRGASVQMVALGGRAARHPAPSLPLTLWLAVTCDSSRACYAGPWSDSCDGHFAHERFDEQNVGPGTRVSAVGAAVPVASWPLRRAVAIFCFRDIESRRDDVAGRARITPVAGLLIGALVVAQGCGTSTPTSSAA